MAVNVHIEQNGNENPMGVLRRFRNRLRTSGVLTRSRSLRYHSRAESPFVKKKGRLRSIEKQEQREKLYKLGKIDHQ